MSTPPIKSEYDAVSVDEIKQLMLFDFQNYKFKTGGNIVSDEFIAAQITLSEEEVYSYCLKNDIQPAEYKPAHFKMVIKKLTVNRIKENMIQHQILPEGTKLESTEDILEKNLRFLIQDREAVRMKKLILPEEIWMNRWYFRHDNWI